MSLSAQVGYFSCNYFNYLAYYYMAPNKGTLFSIAIGNADNLTSKAFKWLGMCIDLLCKLAFAENLLYFCYACREDDLIYSGYIAKPSCKY